MNQCLQVKKIVEEEYCLIPMGGTLPKRDQRTIGVGGTAGLVHPSTGYMVARTLGAVPQLADRIVDELASPLPEDKADAGVDTAATACTCNTVVIATSLHAGSGCYGEASACWRIHALRAGPERLPRTIM